MIELVSLIKLVIDNGLPSDLSDRYQMQVITFKKQTKMKNISSTEKWGRTNIKLYQDDDKMEDDIWESIRWDKQGWIERTNFEEEPKKLKVNWYVKYGQPIKFVTKWILSNIF